MIDNILGSIFSATFLAAILRVTTPILLPSLGALISDRAGVINIGLEGIMLAAAFAGATVLALLLAFFHLHLSGDLILGGIAINILASAGTVAISYELSGGRGSGTTGLANISLPVIDLSILKSLPLVGDFLYTVFGSQNIMTWIAFVAVAVIWFLMYRMPVGKHLRAVGENPDAAASVGISVRRVRYLALAISGVLAALGGIHLSMGYLSFGFTRDMTAGRGFIALVTPALGNGTPFGTMLASVLFGSFAALETRLGGVDIPSQLPQMIPYAATIIALVVYALQRRRVIAARQRRFEQQLRDSAAPAGPGD
jgi:general nucleoside transport system permease protein